MGQVRTILVDDNTDFLKRLRSFLDSEQGFKIIGEANCGEDALPLVLESEPDLVLMDIHMNGLDGISITRLLKAKMPALKVIVLTMFDIEEYRIAAIEAGADNFICKKALTTELIPAMRDLFSVGR